MKALIYSFLILLVLMNTILINAQSNIYSDKTGWTLSTSFQITGGSYIYSEYSMLYLLYGGFRYKSNNLTIYGYIPVVAQNNPGFTQSGMMIIPSGSENEGGGGMMDGGNMHGENNSMDQTSMMNTQISLGDFYLYGSYLVLNDINHWIDVFITPGIKFPTAFGNTGIGTGEFDYEISVNVRKPIESFNILAHAGFIKYGDPEGIDYNNPLTYGFGVGKYLSENGNSILLYYFSYTKILDNYEPPRQISLGLNLHLNPTITLSLIGSKGLSNYSPDFSISGGFNFNL